MTTAVRRLFSPVVELREREGLTAAMMFGFSFFAMTAYNAIKPATRSKFIADLGSENLPYVLLAAGVLIGVLMSGYTLLVSRLPRRWALPITQMGMAGLLIVFWILFQTGSQWVTVAFYLYALILAVLLISQFWTLANVIYDARQAKRLFGFIGGGAPLGGVAGSALASYAKQIGTNNLVLISGVLLAACAVLVGFIVAREKPDAQVAAAAAGEEKGVRATEAFQLLRASKHLQIIALVISFAAIGAAIIEQQLNMATEAAKGQGSTDSITAFLGQVALVMSSIGFVIQVFLTSRIHRYLGIGFALMILPVSLGGTAMVILLNGALWAPSLARILDQSLRYTVDKTTREILFLPLTSDLKMKAKPFVDVSVDRFAKGLGGVLLLVLVQPWGFGLGWQQLSYASLAMTGAWIFMALRARRGYLAAFRHSIERQDVRAADIRVDVADLTTIETLVEELASPDEKRVLYAIDILESLDKRYLITPLLLYHDGPAVRTRVLATIGAANARQAERWLPAVQRMLKDANADVRAAAVVALANLRNEEATDLVRPYLRDRDPRTAATAAIVLARSGDAGDMMDAEATLTRLASDPRPAAAEHRLSLAVALRQIPDPRFRHLLIPLLSDADAGVAEEAMRTVDAIGTADFLFVPTLISLLRHRRLKSGARGVLVGYGEEVLDALNHFLRDPDEDIWVRRHLPATIALIPSQKAMDILAGALDEEDGFLRYKAVTAMEKLRREQPALTFARETIERLSLNESRRYFTYLSMRHNLQAEPALNDSLLVRALTEKIGRTTDRVYRLLGLIYPYKDVAAARWAIERGDARGKSSGIEYLDNLLSGPLRKRVMPMLEEVPADIKVRRGNVLLKTRPRDVEETLLQLMNDEDSVVSAAALAAVRQRQLWNLAGDVEHVLAFRDAHDRYVSEAASWVLAARRGEPAAPSLPAVELAQRLRSLPIFSDLWVDELFRLASSGRQTMHEAGRTLYEEGRAPDAAQFLLEGRVQLQSRAGASRELAPPALLGFDAVLEGAPMRETVRTTVPSLSLELSAEQTRTLLADNSELVEGLVRMLIKREPQHLVLHGGAVDDARRLAETGVTPIERVLALEAVPVLSGIAAEEMLHLAGIARDVTFKADEVVIAAAEPAALLLVLSGTLSAEAEGHAPAAAGPSDAIGLYETLAGVPLGRTVRATQAGVGLRIDRGDLYDLLAQRPELLQQLFTALSASRA